MSALLPFVIGGTSALNGYLNYQSSKNANAANLQAVRETNQTNREIAEMNNDWSLSAMREQNEWNRQQAIDMFRMENEYNTPAQQMQRLRDAGINPAVALGGSATSIANSGDASTPTAAGLPTPVTPQIVSPHFQPVTPFTGGLIQALGDFSKMSLNEAQSNRINTLLEDELRGLKLDNDAQRIANNFEMQFGSPRRQAEYNLLVGQLAKEMSSASLMDVQKETEVEKQLNLMYDSFVKKAQAHFTQKELNVFDEKWNYAKKDYFERWRVNHSVINANNASARLSNAKADTEDAIRQFNVDIARFQSELYGMDKDARAGAFAEECAAIIKEMQNRGRISDAEAKELEERAEEARKHNTMFYYDWFFDKVERINNGANQWAPWAVSRTQSQTTNRSYYDNSGRPRQETTTTNTRQGYIWR